MKIQEKKSKKGSNLIKIGTFLDKTTKIDGDITANTNMKVDGIVNGNVNSSYDIVVGETAIITGNVNARDVVISGRVRGDIYSTETITLTATGKIEGNIQTTGFVVDIGSHFSGNCTIIEKDAPQQQSAGVEATPEPSNA